jgi:aminoglycoside/choline kinase family phosphotransferase
VPAIHAYHRELGIYLESDLGDTTLFDVMMNAVEIRNTPIKELYKMVLHYLPIFQIKAGQSIDYSYCYQYPAFRKDSIEFDLNYFKTSFLARFHRQSFDEKKLHEDFAMLTGKLLEVDSNYFMYRDFQSKNIMILNDGPHFIDYQSARKGALQYDLASLLYDANFVLPNALREELLEHYLDETSNYIKINYEVNRIRLYGVISLLLSNFRVNPRNYGLFLSSPN